jgi:transcriptional regulator with XRE-family HTH domain
MAATTAYAESTTGLDLRVERVRRGLTQTELARRMGVPRQRVSLIEGSIRPTERLVARFMAALDAGE